MAQFTLDKLREFGITPDTKLGQHFLIDDNILRVIGDKAQLDSESIVYEPGAGVGVLSAYLAEHVKHVHAIEIDQRLKPALDDLVGRFKNVEVHWGDAMELTGQSLNPLPTALISNLPYHVAAPIVAETLQHAPTVVSYSAMVQREVADRFFANVSDSNYGGLSVLIQALCTKTATHKVSRSVFIPQPNVDSQLVFFMRRSDEEIGLEPEAVPEFSLFVRKSFGQRRKTLSNNLKSMGFTREEIDAGLSKVGLAPAIRPQDVAPQQFVELWSTIRR